MTERETFEAWWNANETWPVSVKNLALLTWKASRRAALEEAVRVTAQSKTTSHACDAIRLLADGDKHE